MVVSQMNSAKIYSVLKQLFASDDVCPRNATQNCMHTIRSV